MVSDIKSPGIAIGNPSVTGTPGIDKNIKTGELGFGDILKSKGLEKPGGKLTNATLENQAAAQSESLKFSQHAIERMASRGISFKPEEMLKLNDAVEKASQKGSRESLILMGDNALIVSIKNKTVVTAMDKEAMKENVFTNIDSTIIL